MKLTPETQFLLLCIVATVLFLALFLVVALS